MNEPHRAFSSSKKEAGKPPYSQVRLLIILILGTFVAEVMAMIILYYINPEQYWLVTLLDASIMVVLIFPILYFFHFRPLYYQITERDRSEALLSKVLENLPVGVWIVDQNGAILHGNLASQKIWSGVKYVGIDQYGEYKAWRLDNGKLIEPDEWAATRSIRNGETILDEELEIECFDGSRKIILNSATPIFENSTIQGAIVVNQDVTERKHAEQALTKSEALFKTAFQILPVGAWITDESGQIIFGNPAGQAIWAGARYVGIEQFEEYKAWWLETGKAITADEWAVTRAIKKGEISLNEQIEIECFDGTHKIIQNSAIPIRDDEGQMYGVFAVNEDVTERIRYEQELMNSNELIQKAFDSVDVLIAYMDRDFNFIQVNESYAKSGGHPADFYIGRNHFDLYPNIENQEIFRGVLETGKPFSVMEKPFEYTEHPERGVTYWNWKLQPVLSTDGSTQGLVLSLMDVTERKRAEIQLERQNQDLQNLSIAESKQRQLAEGLVQSMLALNSSLELDEVLNNILDQIHHSIPFESGNIVLIEKNDLRIVHQHDLTDKLEELDVPDDPFRLENFPILEKICSTHQPALIEDSANTHPHKLIPGMECFRSYLAVPLIVGERVIGIINLTSNQAGNFNTEISRQLMAFATPAALAVENARLFAAELQARQLAETLNEISLALTETLNTEKVMSTLLEYVDRIVPSDLTYIVIAEDETNLTLKALRSTEDGNSPIQSHNISLHPLEKPYLQDVIAAKKGILIPDTRQYPGWTIFTTSHEMRCWLGIPIMIGSEAIGVLALADSRPNRFAGEHIRLTEVIVAQASVAIQNAWLFEQVRAGHERLQSLSRRLVEIQESERRYIARELHDVASQALTAIMYGLRVLEQEAHQPENILPRLTELKRLTDSVLEELHRLAIGLRPASLDYLGLEVALEQLVKSISEHYQISTHFKAIGSTEEWRLPDHIETNIYRIVQEALTNAVRHAHAKNIDVILECQNEKSIVIIEDDGVGFETSQIPKSGHLGVLGMQERAQMIPGVLQVESGPGCGTTIVLEVPYGSANIDSR